MPTDIQDMEIIELELKYVSMHENSEVVEDNKIKNKKKSNSHQ